MSIFSFTASLAMSFPLVLAAHRLRRYAATTLQSAPALSLIVVVSQTMLHIESKFR